MRLIVTPILSAIAVSVLVGCTSGTDSAEAPPPQRKKGGYVRFVNLSGSVGSATINGQSMGAEVSPGEATPFRLTRQGKGTVEAAIGGQAAKVELDIQPSMSHSVYGLSGTSHFLIEGEPRSNEEAKANVVFVNGTDQPATFSANGTDTQVVSHKLSEAMEFVPGGIEISVKAGGLSAKQPVKLDPGSYTIVLYRSGGTLKLAPVVNHPVVRFDASGASPSG